MPAGLDARPIIEERDRFIEVRMQQRIRKLESLPSTIGRLLWVLVKCRILEFHQTNARLADPPPLRLSSVVVL
ncbi:hypothetical protein B0H16DRAFT_1794981 [Mycena metata]|uniref:Uncharacterized protein n=1 Tax=Mycena metata TaxID=1033252 RepID=A0AAD7JJF6_9AGAR|nr:hypothetical protein B0H16DRAFT_1794981 [Mycena metata]